MSKVYKVEGITYSIPMADDNDWNNGLIDMHGYPVFDKVKEELQELDDEISKNNADKIEAEFGDVLFSMINYARFLKINPENALERTNKKFIKRFQYLEKKAKQLNKPIKDMTLSEMDIYWEEAKKIKK